MVLETSRQGTRIASNPAVFMHPSTTFTGLAHFSQQLALVSRFHVVLLRDCRSSSGDDWEDKARRGNGQNDQRFAPANRIAWAVSLEKIKTDVQSDSEKGLTLVSKSVA
jgi:hypothetical protein